MEAADWGTLTGGYRGEKRRKGFSVKKALGICGLAAALTVNLTACGGGEVRRNGDGTATGGASDDYNATTPKTNGSDRNGANSGNSASDGYGTTPNNNGSDRNGATTGNNGSDDYGATDYGAEFRRNLDYGDGVTDYGDGPDYGTYPDSATRDGQSMMDDASDALENGMRRARDGLENAKDSMENRVEESKAATENGVTGAKAH